MKEMVMIEERAGKRTVSARELHEKLEVTERFNSWFERMLTYGFTKEVDFTSVKSFTVVNNGAKKPIDEYYLSLDMAKEICMIQRSDIGRRFRQYFIECEKNLTKSVEYSDIRTKSKKVRNQFTETLKNHGYTKQYEYINTTKAMKKELGITAKKDDMTLQELASVSASEWLSMAMLTDERGYHEVNPVCIKASDAVIGAIEENRKVAIA